ncbi:DUF3375 domain-containing protein [Nocardiopsis sp. LOL_012]|uniref:DUF3375 domain-containing protein n=1 Tax=Nocardiopsis sp. LOL_012 TaxID=3345409 RepID=UPI003A893059
MDYDELNRLRERDPGWRLLRADSAPMVITFLHRVFVEQNIRTIESGRLVELLDDELYALNERLGERRYPKASKAYVDDWTHPDRGWLRKFYPEQGDLPHVELVPSVERALRWVDSLRDNGGFIGTASRLSSIFTLLRELVHGTEEDPEVHLERLQRERIALEQRIERARRGQVEVLDDLAVRERYQQLSDTARQLLSDFRAVKQNFRNLDRELRERIARWDSAKGDLVAQLVGDRDAIADSDQGRSFQAFYDLLMSPNRQHELTELLGRVQELEAVSDPDPRLRRINHDWLDAAEDTQATVRSLSSQLRRFLDDQAWAENRRVVELSKRIEQHAISLRGDIGNAPGMEIASPAPTLVLPFERPMYKRRHKAPIESDSVQLADDDIDMSALFARSRVDRRQLAGNVWSLLRSAQQVSLTTVVDRFGLEMGLAELVGYLSLLDPRFEVVFDPQRRATVTWVENHDRERTADLPVVVFTRARTFVSLAEE